MEKGASIRIGTSGWTYKHWQEIFYPAKWPKSRWLEYYTKHFDTVELNASFYRLPGRTTFENWKARSPEGFLWSVKGSKFITHTRRLEDPAEPLDRLYKATAGRYPSCETVTADFAYVWLHGSRKLYAFEYSEEELFTRAEKIDFWN